MKTEILRLERVFRARPERVFEVFTTPELLRQWHCGTVGEVIMELRPGGRLRICFTPDENLPDGHCVRGTYHEVTIPSRLVYTWKWDGDEEESLVTVEFRSRGRGCLLKIEHSRLGSQASRDGHSQGWHECLAGLDQLLQLPKWSR